MSKLYVSVDRLKQQAKKVKKELKISQAEALEIVAKQNKFGNWKAVLDADKKQTLENIPTPQISLNFAESEDISFSPEDRAILEVERKGEFHEIERLKVNSNKKELVKLGIEFSIFEPTLTGLKKSILDATQQVRTHFELENFHFYENQKLGQEYKITKKAFFLKHDEHQETRMSIYRPLTKKGDPRMWFSSLPKFTKVADQIAIIIRDNSAYLINLSEFDLEKEYKSYNSFIGAFLRQYIHEVNEIAQELLNKLKSIAENKIRATHKGDTAIGMSIEHALGIPANSSKQPDYKGIELKAGRNPKNRATLFAQVADWSLSALKSSSEILAKYGYERGEDRKLYCTVSTLKVNSQGLILKYDKLKDELQEWDYYNNSIIAVWPGSLLRNRLYEKHSETFWIDATSMLINHVEYFSLKKVTHTKTPLLSQFMPLIESGVITMDHLIKKSAKGNKVSEKGPLFRMNKKDLDLLFPKPTTYKL
jgi:hypothetical protein